MCVVPFSKPSIAPSTDQEQEAFEELEDMLSEGTLSSVCGWAISLEKVLVNKEKVREMKSVVREHLEGRFASNWTLLAVCHMLYTQQTLLDFFLIMQLLLESGFPALVDGALEFIFQQSKNCSHGLEGASTVIDVIVKTIDPFQRELVRWRKEE